MLKKIKISLKKGETGSVEGQNRQSALKLFSGIEPPPYYRRRSVVNYWAIIWTVFGLLIVTTLVIYSQAIYSVPSDPLTEENKANIAILSSPTLSPTPSATLTATPQAGPETPASGLVIAEETATPTPVPGGQLLYLFPNEADTGWVVSNDETIISQYDPQNHFGDSFLYAGVLDGKIYHGAIQFDLSRVPRGSKIYAASLRLTGLRQDQLGRMGEWRLQLLGSEIDYNWQTHNYQQLLNASIWTTFEPSLTSDQLGKGRVNLFEFNAEQLALLERRVLEGSDLFGKKLSFRLDGPVQGGNNLFAWDTGYGPASAGVKPELFLSLGPPPEETPPPYYVVVTSTPTPQDIRTAVAGSLRMTAEAMEVGTATPLPPHWVTPFVVTPTPTPGNEATARVMSELATAIALTTGEPPNAATATPSPTYVIITSTPTPLNVMTAAAISAQMTAEAAQNGTATPFPPNWVTPVVVTSTPTPQNTATVDYLTAVALTTGTPTPLPENVQTATPTPVFIIVQPFVWPTPTPILTGTPQPIPAPLLGKIVFLSDREGATEEERLRAYEEKATPQVTPQPYVFDPETGQLGRLTSLWPYQIAAARDAWSADTTYEAYTQQLLWSPPDTLAIHYYDYKFNVEQAVTRMGVGIVYDPVWSPTSNEIAFVATETGNDEIWVINHDGTNVRQLTYNTWEWDKHPSWSPDGQQIVFFSNRSGNSQIWIMNKDGTEQRPLMDWTPYNDWDPVWIKYLEPAPPSERKPDWRFVKPTEEKPVTK